MSALPGKVVIQGVTEIYGEKVFMLSMLQGRNPEWCRKPFFAKYDPKATWLTDLRPAFGEKKFFYQDELNELIANNHGQMYFDGESEGGVEVDEEFAFDD
jgi:hypothetical protein